MPREIEISEQISNEDKHNVIRMISSQIRLNVSQGTGQMWAEEIMIEKHAVYR